MKIYCVVQMYYENGDVIPIIIEEEHNEKPQNTCEELESYDLYKDYFASKQEAEEFYEQTLLA